MVRGTLEDSQTLSELTWGQSDFFRFLGTLLSMEEEEMISITPRGEKAVVKSALSFIQEMTPTELMILRESTIALTRRLPTTRYGRFEEYAVIMQALGLAEPPPPAAADENPGSVSEAGADMSLDVDIEWDESSNDEEASLGDIVTSTIVPVDDFALAVIPTLASCLETGKRFLDEGWPGMARDRFEEALKLEPHSALAKAYLAWMDFQKNPHSTDVRRQVDQALDKALRIFEDHDDILLFRGMLLKLDGKLKEAKCVIRKALDINPKHARARCQMRIVNQRLQETEWPTIDFRTARVDAPIIIQRRVFGKTKTYSFRENEIRIGSGEQDHVMVSATTLPDLVKRHCTVQIRDGQHFVRRVASLGRVWINGREIEARKDEPVLPDDCIRLGQTEFGPALEFRVFDVKSIVMPNEDQLSAA